MEDMLDISLAYALSQCDEKTIDTILAAKTGSN